MIGLGRIGLPHALVSADSGNLVYGIDKNSWVIKTLIDKKTPFNEPAMKELLVKHLNTRFFVTADMNDIISKVDVIVICIGTRAEKRSDTSDLFRLVSELSKYDIKDKLIILRPTLPIGTTDLVRKTIEKLTGLLEGKHYFLVHSPERLVEGNAIEEERKLPKIIGAYNDEGFLRAKMYFKTIGGPIVRVSEPRVSEFIKLVDNAWRQLTFAFANDVAILAEYLGLDALEIIKAANYKYPRNQIPLPSYGVSGYCLTKDPYFLEESFEEIAKQRKFHSLWYYGRLTNDYMITHVRTLIDNLVNKYKHNIKPIKVVVLGLSYKNDVDDFRLSHGIDIVRILLQDAQFKISVYDPYLDLKHENPYTSLATDLRDSVVIESELNNAFLNKDVAILTVPHREFRELNKSGKIIQLIKLMRKPPIIIDGWNVFTKLYDCRNETGIIYWGVGRGLR